MEIRNILTKCFKYLDTGRMGKDDFELAVRDFKSVLSGFNPKDVKMSFSSYIASENVFPCPQDIVKWCLAEEVEREKWGK